jgi:hypothetical protein
MKKRVKSSSAYKITYSGFPLDSQVKVKDCPSCGKGVDGIILTDGVSRKKNIK